MRQVKPLPSWNDDNATALLALDEDWRAIVSVLRIAADTLNTEAQECPYSELADLIHQDAVRYRALADKIEQEISE